jgi:hypothetical protein
MGEEMLSQNINSTFRVPRSAFKEFRKTGVLQIPFERFETVSDSLNFIE